MGAPWIIKKAPSQPEQVIRPAVGEIVEVPPEAPVKKVKVSKKKALAKKAADK